MTHTKDEALKLALEALDSMRIVNFSVENLVGWNKAMTAIKQALATQLAPVQEPQRYSPDGEGGMEVDSLGAYVKLQDVTTQPAQPAPVQEPVAWRSQLASGNYTYCNTPQFFDNAEPLYTTPPAQPAVQEPVAWGKPTDEMVQAATDEYDEWAVDNKGTTECIRAMLVKALKVQPTAQQAPVQPVQEPEIVQRVKRYAGQTMRTARNPNITARECIELANWIAGGHPATQPAVPLTDEQKRDLIKKSALWDMHIHIGWYSAPAKSFVEKTIQLIADIEAAHGITKGQS
jgi:hypothetical protein